MEGEFADLRDGEDFAVGVEMPRPDADDFKPPLATDAMKPERGEAHREAQRKGAINQWQAKDKRDGVPEPVPQKERKGSKRTSIEVLLARRATEDSSIQGSLNEFVRMTADELGGIQNLRAGQKAMLLCQKIALSIILACEDQLVSGDCLMDEDGKPHAFLGVLEKYLGTFRQGQIALGLGLRSRMPRDNGITIERVVAEYASRSKPLLVPEKRGKKDKKDTAG